MRRLEQILNLCFIRDHLNIVVRIPKNTSNVSALTTHRRASTIPCSLVLVRCARLARVRIAVFHLSRVISPMKVLREQWIMGLSAVSRNVENSPHIPYSNRQC